VRTVIERVTYDKCGQVHDFEKYSEGIHLARLESLSEWLQSLGWCLSDGFHKRDICPNCGPKARGKA
jgi:hypothetical protein